MEEDMPRTGRKPRPYADRRHVQAMSRLLDARKWSQRDLSQASGIDRTTVGNIMAGKNVSLDTLEALAKAFAVDISELFPPPPKPEPEAQEGGLNAESLRVLLQLAQAMTRGHK